MDLPPGPLHLQLVYLAHRVLWIAVNPLCKLDSDLAKVVTRKMTIAKDTGLSKIAICTTSPITCQGIDDRQSIINELEIPYFSVFAIYLIYWLL